MNLTLPNVTLLIINNGERATCGDGSTPFGVVNRMQNQLLQNDSFLLNSINNNVSKNNTDSRDPNVSDDVSLGYSIGSKWINSSTSHIWICTKNTAGSATWIDVTLTNQSSYTDELVKVGENGSGAFLSQTYFERDGVEGIRPIERIDNSSSASNRFLSSNYIKANFSKFKRNITFDIRPVYTDDSSKGYVVGSMWFVTSLKETWICVKNQLNNAKWVNASKDVYVALSNDVTGNMSDERDSGEFRQDYFEYDSDKITMKEKINDTIFTENNTLSAAFLRSILIPIEGSSGSDSMYTLLGQSSTSGSVEKFMQQTNTSMIYIDTDDSAYKHASTRVGNIIHIIGGVHTPQTYIREIDTTTNIYRIGNYATGTGIDLHSFDVCYYNNKLFYVMTGGQDNFSWSPQEVSGYLPYFSLYEPADINCYLPRPMAIECVNVVTTSITSPIFSGVNDHRRGYGHMANLYNNTMYVANGVDAYPDDFKSRLSTSTSIGVISLKLDTNICALVSEYLLDESRSVSYGLNCNVEYYTFMYVGGIRTFGANPDVVNLSTLFNAITSTASTLQMFTSQVAMGSLSETPDYVYLFGGKGNDNVSKNSIYRYTKSNNTWAYASNLADGNRKNHTSN